MRQTDSLERSIRVTHLKRKKILLKRLKSDKAPNMKRSEQNSLSSERQIAAVKDSEVSHDYTEEQ
jgi:hypothetical protein